MDSPKFAEFDISEVTYKVFHGQDIKAFVMIPKNASRGKHPVMSKFHGGGFVSLFPPSLSISNL
jgi:cephalosporin-C deacetylase-like acetyl esterase